MVRSSFFEFNVAVTGLTASRAGLEVTSHNMANAAAKGFSRQYIEQRASYPLTYGNGKGMIGTGTEVYGVGQMRSFYLDKKYWSENCVLGEYDQKAGNLTVIEDIFAELSETGVIANLNKFFNALEDLSTTANDSTYRNNVLASLQQLTSFINSTAETLKKNQRDVNEEVNTVVQTINSLGQQISSLNSQIHYSEMDGSRANDLRDARALLVDELSRYVNVEVEEIERNADYAAGLYPEPEDRNYSDKQFIVRINGNDFVSGEHALRLETRPREEKLNPTDVEWLYDVYYSNSSIKFDIYSPTLKGELKGLIDVRDGNNGLYCSSGDGASGVSVTAGDAQAGTPHVVTILNPTRTDLLNSGYITLTDPKTGNKKEYAYTNYKYDEGPPPTATFEIDSKAALPSYAGTANASVGQTDSYKGIPHYMNKLNTLVRTLAKAFNEGVGRSGESITDVTGHVDGYDYYGENMGYLLFTYDGSVTNGPLSDYEYNQFTCDSFQVNPELLKDPLRLATAVNGNDGVSANEVVNGFIYLKQYKSLFAEGSLTDYMIGTAGELGIDLAQAKNFTISYMDVVNTIDIQRMSVSGVSMDEEVVNMLRYQQVYQACSKMINVINGIYETLINRMGV